jgi:hypothetical protein
MFQTKRDGQGTEIRNLKTEEAFVFDDAHDTMDALEIAARLTMEDLSVLMVNADGDYYLCVISSFCACHTQSLMKMTGRPVRRCFPLDGAFSGDSDGPSPKCMGRYPSGMRK